MSWLKAAVTTPTEDVKGCANDVHCWLTFCREQGLSEADLSFTLVVDVPHLLICSHLSH